MKDRDHEFTQETVDERIQHLLREAPYASQPEHRLIQDLRTVYSDSALIGERVWTRLAEHVVQYQEQQVNLPLGSDEVLPSKGDMESNAPGPLRSRPRGSPRRSFALVGAFLVVVVLIGSFLWTFTVFHQAERGATTGNQIAVPPSCPSSGTPGWPAICNRNMLEAINQSQRLPNGLTLTVLGAFDNGIRVVIWYDLSPVNTNLSRTSRVPLAYSSLQTLQGIPLAGLTFTGIHDLEVISAPEHHVQWIESFDASTLPASLKAVGLKLAVNADAIERWSGFSSTTRVSPVYTFTLPTHDAADRTLSLKQTVTMNGVAITLGSLKLYAGDVSLVLSSTHLSYRIGADIQVSRLPAPSTSSIWEIHRPGSSLFEFVGLFNFDLTKHPGDWALTIFTLDAELPTWVFHFTVPAPAVGSS